MKHIIAACLLTFCAAPVCAQNVPVPFVGCPADGQMGPQDAPPPSATPLLPPAQAKYLALYAGPYMSVLAPRGWHCAEAYGSSGGWFVVTQQPIPPDYIIGKYEITGPAVQFSVSDGETSGRFEVALMAARLFPAAHAFVERIKAENLMPASDFATTPDAGDQITRHGDFEADFVTPPHQDGLGTDSHLVPGKFPIRGFALLVPDGPDFFSLFTLDVRLPPGSEALLVPIAASAQPPAPE